MISAGYRRAVAITLADADVDLGFTAKAFFVGGAGNLKVTTGAGDAVTLNGLAAGTTVFLQVRRFWSTGSTATNIVALGD